MKQKTLGFAALSISLALALPANGRAPRVLGDPLFGDWLLSIKATCLSADGATLFKEASETTVTISAATAVEGVFTPTHAMSGFTIVPASPQGPFDFGPLSGIRYGTQFYFAGDGDFGAFRGRLKIDGSGLGVSFKATAQNVDSFGLVDAKIKGTRVLTR
ncbi:MAG TPA: hypothetical protein VFI25_03230 [Planctomycetota bacterium]|jgi:hypothetical protein|nr:hypothetical protein [Planctomycetota bacterium]